MPEMGMFGSFSCVLTSEEIFSRGILTTQLTGNIDRCFLLPGPGKENLLFVEGWILHPEEKIIALSLGGSDQSSQTAVLSSRPDVATMIPHIPHASMSGFAILMKEATALSMKAQTADNRFTFVSIPLKKKILAPGLDPLVEAFSKLRSKDDFASLSKSFLNLYFSTSAKITFKKLPKPAYSIIIPVHNRAEYTLLALWSLSLQTCLDYEIIVVDNASTDQTKQLLAKIEGIEVLSAKTNLHYIEGCNRGAAHAKGEILLFLNNDCIVHRSALERITHHFQNSEIGAVGGLLLTPQGIIQEAGCRALFDGSTIGINRFLDPKDAGDSGEVDYCSGAFLATPKKLFDDVGGFNEAFTPAYGEDVDYALTLKEHGKKIICDTSAIIVHLEHGSSEHNVYVTQLIEKSKEILQQRHPQFFSWPFIEKIDRTKQNLLIIDDLAPDKTKGQGLPRAALLLDELSKHFSSITIIAVTEADRSPPTLNFPSHIHCITSIPRAGLPRFFERYGDRFSAIMISRPPNMEALVKVKLPSNIPILYDAESVFAFREITKRQLSHHIHYSQAEIKEIVDKEVALAIPADIILAVSEQEAQRFRSHGFQSVEVLSHGVPIITKKPSPTNRKGLLTVSPIISGESPNFDGNQWFIREIFPKINSHSQNSIEFTVAGEVLPSLKEYFEIPSVSLAGPVKDLTTLYSQARVFIAPTRFGAGIPLKVIEASAFGLPSVVTPLLAAQLGWIEGQEFLIGKNAEDFANKVLSLITDDTLWEHISTGALKRIGNEYSIEHFRSKISSVIAKIQNSPPPNH